MSGNLALFFGGTQPGFLPVYADGKVCTGHSLPGTHPNKGDTFVVQGRGRGDADGYTDGLIRA